MVVSTISTHMIHMQMWKEEFDKRADYECEPTTKGKITHRTFHKTYVSEGGKGRMVWKF